VVLRHKGDNVERDQDQDKAWNTYLTNYGESEYHRLSKEDLLDILQEEWGRAFNGIIIGRDIDCVGRLLVFFCHSDAYVAYEDFVNNAWWCSYHLKACAEPGWDELVRLTPDDTEEYSFRRCSIIRKEQALTIVQYYLTSGELRGLYKSDENGKPILGSNVK
jgi:hypothetical protein